MDEAEPPQPDATARRHARPPPHGKVLPAHAQDDRLERGHTLGLRSYSGASLVQAQSRQSGKRAE